MLLLALPLKTPYFWPLYFPAFLLVQPEPSLAHPVPVSTTSYLCWDGGGGAKLKKECIVALKLLSHTLQCSFAGKTCDVCM